MLNNKNVLITGGTGSFGKIFIKKILNHYPKIKKLIIFSRDELKQFELAQIYDPNKISCLRYFLGDVRDLDRLKLAFRNVDVVIHAAALKQVPAGEYNPFEFIQTNIIGAQNIINACLVNKVKNLVALSTDKASSPINLYGATKLCSDKLFVAANNIFGNQNFKISIVRYGNVFGSRGSVVPLFYKQSLDKKKTLTVTDENMTRFNIFLEDGVETVLWTLKNAIGGEIVIPKAPSFNVLELAKAFGKKCKIKIIGKKPGEKMHEELISKDESYHTIQINKYFVILPENNILKKLNIYKKNHKIIKFPKGNSYNSYENSEFLPNKKLIEMVKKFKNTIKIIS